MALTKAKVREILSEAGVDAEHMVAAVGSIIDGHTASINALREERETAQTEAERFKTETTRLTEELQKATTTAERTEAASKTALEQANATAESRVQAEVEKASALQRELDELKAKYATAETTVAELTRTKTEYEAYKAEQEAKATNASKEAAFADLLKDMNLSEKGMNFALKYTDMNTVEINDKGKISNAAALRRAVTEEWGDFIQQEETKGADTAIPPAGNAVPTGKTATEILAIKDDGDMMAEILANPAAFGLS